MIATNFVFALFVPAVLSLNCTEDTKSARNIFNGDSPLFFDEELKDYRLCDKMSKACVVLAKSDDIFMLETQLPVGSVSMSMNRAGLRVSFYKNAVHADLSLPDSNPESWKPLDGKTAAFLNSFCPALQNVYDSVIRKVTSDNTCEEGKSCKFCALRQLGGKNAGRLMALRRCR